MHGSVRWRSLPVRVEDPLASSSPASLLPPRLLLCPRFHGRLICVWVGPVSANVAFGALNYCRLRRPLALFLARPRRPALAVGASIFIYDFHRNLRRRVLIRHAGPSRRIVFFFFFRYIYILFFFFFFLSRVPNSVNHVPGEGLGSSSFPCPMSKTSWMLCQRYCSPEFAARSYIR